MAKRIPKLHEIERMVIEPGVITNGVVKEAEFIVYARTGRTVRFGYALSSLERVAFERWFAKAAVG